MWPSHEAIIFRVPKWCAMLRPRKRSSGSGAASKFWKWCCIAFFLCMLVLTLYGCGKESGPPEFNTDTETQCREDCPTYKEGPNVKCCCHQDKIAIKGGGADCSVGSMSGYCQIELEGCMAWSMTSASDHSKLIIKGMNGTGAECTLGSMSGDSQVEFKQCYALKLESASDQVKVIAKDDTLDTFSAGSLAETVEVCLNPGAKSTAATLSSSQTKIKNTCGSAASSLVDITKVATTSNKSTIGGNALRSTAAIRQVQNITQAVDFSPLNHTVTLLSSNGRTWTRKHIRQRTISETNT